MAKITLDGIVSGFKSVAKIISNFDSIEDNLNNKVLYRDNPEGEPNQMNTDLDMNSQRITNLPSPTNDNDAARWVDVKDGVTTLDATLPSLTGNTDRALSTDGAILVFKDGDDLSFTNTAAGASRRTVGDKLSEIVSVEDFGAVGDGSTDDLAAINNALATGLTVAFKAGTTYRVSGLPAFSNSNIIANGATLDIDAGLYTSLSPATIDSTQGTLNITCDNYTLIPDSDNLSAVTGSSGDWSLTLDVTDTSDVSVGDYVVVTASSNFLSGFWEVTAVVTNTSITVKNTNEATTFPVTVGAASMTLRKPSVVLSFSTSGIDVKNGNINFSTGSQDWMGFVGTSGSVLSFSEESRISGYVFVNGGNNGLALDEVSSAYLDTGYFSNCSSSGLSVLDNSFANIDTLVASGCVNGVSVQRSNATLTGNVAGNSSINVDLGAGFLGGTLTVTVADASATGMRLNSGAVSYASLDVDGASFGVYMLGGSYFRGSGDIDNCTTAFYLRDISSADTTLSSLSGNTTNYDYDEGSTVLTSVGVYNSKSEFLALSDGAAIPTTTAGQAFLYVDTADGDLKVKFGDGTVKTIATDT